MHYVVSTTRQNGAENAYLGLFKRCDCLNCWKTVWISRDKKKASQLYFKATRMLFSVQHIRKSLHHVPRFCNVYI